MDIKDSYLHGTVGVVKSISVSADKLKYTLADIAGTVREVTLPVATTSANGLMSSADKNKLDAFNSGSLKNNLVLKINSGTTEGTSLYTYNGSAAKTLDIKNGTGIGFTNNAGSLQIYNSGVRAVATGTTNGTISVNTNGTSADVAVKGLGSAAYKETNNFLWISNKPSNINGSNTYDLNNSYDSDCIIHDYQWTNGPNNKINSVINLVYLSDWKNQLVFTPSLTTISYRSYSGSAKSWSNWKTIAFTDSDITGNAATATHASTADKLETKRKLWGLDFDGSADVSGSLSGVTKISCNNTSLAIATTGTTGYIYLRYLDDNSKSVVLADTYFGPTEGSNNALTLGKSSGKWKAVYATDFIGNLDGSYVNKLTNYTKATAIGAIAATDSLNTALGKLEYKADTAYDLVKGAYDGDGTIENLAEILKVLEGISDTETIKAIIGKYLPLTGGKLNSGTDTPLVILGTAHSWIEFKNSNNSNLGWIGVLSSKQPSFFSDKSYKIWHEGNDGIGSGLDADLFQGNGESAYFRYRGEIDTSYVGITDYNDNATDFKKLNNGAYSINKNTYSGLLLHLECNGSTHALEITTDYWNTAPILVRRVIDNKRVSGAWKALAFTDSDITGNAASADKLSTSRKLWGQSFNGTADVKGDMTDVGSIRMDNSSCLFVENTEGSAINLLTLNSQNLFALGWSTCPNGYLTSIYGNVITFGTGSNRNEIMRLNSNGKVGIGATNPDSILHVNGTSNNGTPVLKVTSTSTTSDYNYVASFLSPNLGEKGNVIMSLGVAHDTKKCAILQYITDSDVSKNRLAIGHYGGIQMLTIGSANVGIGTTNPSTTYKLDVVSSTINVIRVKSSGNESSIAYDSASSSWTAGVGTGSSGNAFGFWSNTAGKNVLLLKSDKTVHAETFVGNILLGDIHNIKSAKYRITLTDGKWYRIMETSNSQAADALGEVTLYLHNAGNPNTIKLLFGLCYDHHAFINCPEYVAWSQLLSKARIVYANPYTSQKAYIEIYSIHNITHDATFSFTGTGWNFITPTETTEEYTENLNSKVEIILNPNVPTYSSSLVSAGFARKNSNNDYVLLGGGGHKLISDFVTNTTGLFTSATSTRDTNLSLTIGGTTKTINNLYATSLKVQSNGYSNNPKGEWNKVKTSTNILTLNVYDVYNDGGPTSYGNVLEIVGISNHWLPLLWFSAWKGGDLKHRNKDTGNSDSDWGEWYTILDSNNYKSYLGYIGTTAVQATSAVLDLTGIGHVTPGASNTYKLGNSDNLWGWVCSVSLLVSLITVSALNGSVFGIAKSWTDCAKDDNGINRPWYGLTWDTNIPSGSSGPNHNQMFLSNYFGMTFRTGSTGCNFVFLTGNVRPYSNNTLNLGASGYRWSTIYGTYGNFTGDVTVTANVSASKFITSGGTSSHFVKGDGSLDNNTYATTSSLGNYVTLDTKLTISGIKTFSAAPLVPYITYTTVGGKLNNTTSYSWRNVYACKCNTGGDNIMIHLTHGYHHLDTDSVTLLVNVGYFKASIMLINSLGGYKAFNKARVRWVDNGSNSYSVYVDVYTYNRTPSTDSFYVTGSGKGSFYAFTESDGAGSVIAEHDIIYNGLSVPNAKIETLTLSGQLTSTLADGTAPFVVTSTTKVANLNADYLDGKSATNFCYNVDGLHNLDCNAPTNGSHSAVYRFSSAPTNVFPNAAYGNLLVVGNGSDTAFQLGAPYSQEQLFFRTGVYKSGYTNSDGITQRSWKQIAFIDSDITGNAATATRSKYLETLKQDGSGWYGDSYKFYTQWGSSTILDLKCDGYSTRVDIARKINSETIISAKALSLSNASWTDTGYTFASLASGTYAVQVTCGNLVASGIMSVYKNIDDTAGDEIPLHVYHDSTQPWRPYLRTSGKKLLISSNDGSATSRTVTIKIALIL